MSGSYAYYRHLRDQAHTLDGLAAWSKVALSIATGGEGIAVYGNIVSGNYFSVLGTRPALGRFFPPDEDRTPLANPVIVVSHAFWETRLGGRQQRHRPAGERERPSLSLSSASRHPAFRGVFSPLKADAWVPLHDAGAAEPGRDLADDRGSGCSVVSRPGVDREAAQPRAGGADEGVGARDTGRAGGITDTPTCASPRSRAA